MTYVQIYILEIFDKQSTLKPKIKIHWFNFKKTSLMCILSLKTTFLKAAANDGFFL